MTDLHQPGEIVHDRYLIQNTLGKGAVGTTYAAYDSQQEQVVALKVLSLSAAGDWKVLELFEREAQTLATLNHLCIPTYLDHFHVDTDRDRHFYLVQELIEGRSLETLIRGQGGRTFKEADVQGIAIQVLDILDYLHRLNPPVIHRDIKPQNLIYTRDRRIVLVDFGAVQEAFRHTMSRGGTFVGTVDYMPPEQFRGQATYASDLYSLGVTLIDLLTGPKPISDLPEQRLKIDFRAALQVSPHFAQWLDRLIEPAAEDRFQSTTAARQALLHTHSSQQPRPPQPIAPPQQTPVILNTTSDRLTLHVPPLPWNLATGFASAFNLGCGGFWALTTMLMLGLLGSELRDWIWQSASSFEDGHTLLEALVLAFFILPLWCVPWFIWTLVRRIRGDTVELELRPDDFQLKYRCFPLSCTVTGDLTQLNIQPQSHRRGIKLVCLTQRHSIQRSRWGWTWQSNRVFEYRFAQWLTPKTQYWLAQELALFVKDAQQSSGVRNETKTRKESAPPTPAGALPVQQGRLELRRDRDRFDLIVSPIFVGQNQIVALGAIAFVQFLLFPFGLFLAVPLLMMRSGILWALAGSFSLHIDAEQFELHWQYLGWRHQVTGKTRHLQGAEFGPTNISINKQPLMACLLITQRRCYCFGSWLRGHEKDRVVAELQNFLTRLPTEQ